MSADDGATTGPESQGSGPRTTTDLLKSIGHTVWPLVMAGGGLVGFVALAGSAIVWTRFSATEVPPDQVVAVYPRGELVAIAASLLLLFGLAGLLAVGMCYLIDPKGRASIGMTRGLLTVLAVEGLAVILFIVGAESRPQRFLAAALFVLCLGSAFWVTAFYVRLPDTTHVKRELDQRRRQFVWIAAGTLVVVVAIGGVVAIRDGLEWRLALGGLIMVGAVPSVWAALRFRDGINASLTPTERAEREREKAGSFRVPFTRDGMYLIAVLIGLGVISPAIVVGSFWLAISLTVAAVLFVALWRCAVVPKDSFLWFGFVVFVSVPLFGTLTWMAQNVFEPQVQPMALIRKSDGADEYLQGLFVAETDNRVYFATVGTEGCSDNLTPSSGRLLWVPKSEIVAIAIGPLQSVTRARRTSLEMSYALSPDAAGPRSVADVEPTKAPGKASAARRLESVGAAVQPNFGAGLVLEPPTAAPGEIVTLRMSSPNPSTRGFGRSRHHRALRVGGVPVEVIKEQARGPWEAEYVETSDGKTLKLGKQIVYAREAGVYSAVSRHDPPQGGPLFVRISDGSVVAVDDHRLARKGYLRVTPRKGAPVEIARGPGGALPVVTLRDGSLLTLKPALLRQAWHEDHIKFRVPPGSTTGPVTIECNQLTSSPLLHVARPPEARIAVQIVPGTKRVLLDSSRSRDDNGTIVSRHWTVQGLDSGRGKLLSEALRPRRQPYSIRLTLVDSAGESASAHLSLFRLPGRLVRLGPHGVVENDAALRSLSRAVHKAIASETPESIALEAGVAKNVARPDPDLTLEEAEQLRGDLMSAHGRRPSLAPLVPGGLTIRTLAFGNGCSAAHQGSGRRFDLLILGQGAQVVPFQSCPPLRSRTTRRLLAPR